MIKCARASGASLLAALALTLGLALPVAADQKEIQRVIGDQVAAFEQDDFARAFGFASEAIRRLFGTPERFGRMVREGYPMVYRPDSLRFGAAREGRGRVIQRVIVTDAEGKLHLLDYDMIETDAGWRINGVIAVQAPQAGA